MDGATAFNQEPLDSAAQPGVDPVTSNEEAVQDTGSSKRPRTEAACAEGAPAELD